MNLGIFLSPGESIKSMQETGQDERFANLYLKAYSRKFNKIYLFSYSNETARLPKSVVLVSNKSAMHRILYGILLPIIHKKEIKDCEVIRGFGLASSISSFFLNKPFVFNWAFDYTTFVKMERKYLYIPFYFALEKIAFFKAAKVLIATKEKFHKVSKKDKFVYLPNGVDLKSFKPISTKNKRAEVIYVGRLEAQKNLLFLLDSIATLPPKLRKITFIGAGSLKKHLIEHARNKKVQLQLKEPVKHSVLPHILSSYKVFALPSHVEGSPKVLLEAMACGLVPVVSAFSTAKEIVTNTVSGFIVNFNKKEFSQQLKRLLSNKKIYDRMSRQALKTIRENFDQEKLINIEIGILQKAARNK